MSQIEISCIGSDAIFTNTPNIFSGGNVDSVKFKFDSDWSGFTTKTAVFYNNPKDTALQLLDSNNVTKIPPEMLANKGKLSIGVIGTKGSNGDVKTSKILTYIVGKGAVTDDLETTSATPDIWLQMLSIVSHNKDIVDNMELIVDENQLANKANKDLSNVSSDVWNSMPFAKIESGSYVGTGNVGENGKNTLTFNFAPKVVWLIKDGGRIYNCFRNTTEAYIDWANDNHMIGINLIWGENSLSWYHTDSVIYQFNTLNQTYYYVAIG